MNPFGDQEPERASDEAEARPRGIPALAAVSMAAAFSRMQHAEAEISVNRSDRLPTPHDLPTALLQATWRTAQDHRRLSEAVDVGVMLMSVLLFVASSRVLFRAKGGGWLWRQAFLGNALAATAVAVVEHMLRPGRMAALRAILANPTAHIPPPPGVQGMTHLQVGEWTFVTSIVLAWGVVALFAWALRYTSRERTRAWIDA